MTRRTSEANQAVVPAEDSQATQANVQEIAIEQSGEILREEDLVPGWLALLVLVLLLAVTALGGFVLRGALVKDTTVTRSGYAVSEWEAKVKAEPEDVESLLSLAYAYQQDGQYQKALDEYEQVLTRDPQNLAALYNKGAVLMELGDAKKAETAYWDTLKIAPDHALAAKALGELYLAQKHYKSALVAVDPVLETRADLADLQYISGFANEQLGNTEKAIERYKAAASFDLVEARDALRRLGVEQ